MTTATKKCATRRRSAPRHPTRERRAYPVALDLMPLTIRIDAVERRRRRAARLMQMPGWTGPVGEEPIMFMGTMLPSGLDFEVTKRIHNVLRRWIARRFARRGWVRTGDYVVESHWPTPPHEWFEADTSVRTLYVRTPYVVPDAALRKALGSAVYMLPPQANALVAMVET